MIIIFFVFVYVFFIDCVFLLDNILIDIDGLFCELFFGILWFLFENYDYNWMNIVIWENINWFGCFF